MKTFAISCADELHTLRDTWNGLAGDIPFRSHEWLATWWKHYGGTHSRERRLHIVCVESGDGTIVAIAPWYTDRSFTKGRTIRWLGDGEVCTDHLTLLCRPEHRAQATETLARHLATEFTEWELVELEGVDGNDSTMETFAAQLRTQRSFMRKIETQSCWSIELPSTWDAFLQLQSKSHRKQLERLHRKTIEAGRTVWHRVGNLDEFARAWPLLIDLHQRRWGSLDESGVFSSQTYCDFHWEVAQLMLARGYLRLSWLELDGAPIAAEYHFANRDTTFVYQGGIDPDRLDDRPGRIIKMLSIREAIESGQTTYDFLRGNEPYKARWRAEPHSACRLLAVPPRQSARFRAQAYETARQVKGLWQASNDWLRRAAAIRTGETS